MGRYCITRQIRATPEQVFRAFVDPALVADWMDAEAVAGTTGPLDMPGSQYTLIIRGPWRFRTLVVRSEPPWLHETALKGPLGTSVRMVATLSPRDGGTDLDLLTEYTMPLGSLGRWIDRQWIDREPRPTANREVDRLVTLVSGPQPFLRHRGKAVGLDGRALGLDDEVEQAQAAFLDREVAGWSSRRVRWSGGETQVIEAGAGEPLLLVHGGMGNAADWAPLMGRLALTRRVIAVDRPGHGLASTFDYRGVDIWRHGAAFLVEMADALGLETVDVAGCSMGGAWAIALAEAHPERVRHLVLVGAPAGSQQAMIPLKIGVLAWPVVGSLIGAMVRRGSPEGTRSFWKGLIVAHPERLSEELLRFEALAARRNVGTWLSLVRNFGSVRGLRRHFLIDPPYLIEPHLRRVAAPVTFVWGERDAFDTPDRGRELVAATIRPGHVVVIPDAGHLPWIDEPDLVASAVLSAVSYEGTGRRAGREPEPADRVAV